MGKTLKYGSHDFPAGFGFTGSSGEGKVPVRQHARARAGTTGEAVPPRGVPSQGQARAYDARASSGEKIAPAGVTRGPNAAFDKKASSGEYVPPAGKSVARLKGGGRVEREHDQDADDRGGKSTPDPYRGGGKVGVLSRFAKGGRVEAKNVPASSSKLKPTYRSNQRNPMENADQPQIAATNQVREMGRPGQKLMPGYRGGGRPRNFDQGGVVTGQDTAAAPDLTTRLRKVTDQLGMAVAPLSRQRQLAPSPGGSVYQGAPSATTPSGITVQPAREAEQFNRGTAPLTPGALSAAIGNAIGVINPIETTAKMAAATALGMDPSALGGWSDIPGYQGPDPTLAARVAAGQLTGNEARAMQAARAGTDNAGRAVGVMGNAVGGYSDPTNRGGDPYGNRGDPTSSSQAGRAGFRRGGSVKGGRKR
jgi:hypothetical protein